MMLDKKNRIDNVLHEFFWSCEQRWVYVMRQRMIKCFFSFVFFISSQSFAQNKDCGCNYVKAQKVCSATSQGDQFEAIFGHVSKSAIGLLYAKDIVDGSLSYDDRIEDYLPYEDLGELGFESDIRYRVSKIKIKSLLEGKSDLLSIKTGGFKRRGTSEYVGSNLSVSYDLLAEVWQKKHHVRINDSIKGSKNKDINFTKFHFPTLEYLSRHKNSSYSLIFMDDYSINLKGTCESFLDFAIKNVGYLDSVTNKINKIGWNPGEYKFGFYKGFDAGSSGINNSYYSWSSEFQSGQLADSLLVVKFSATDNVPSIAIRSGVSEGSSRPFSSITGEGARVLDAAKPAVEAFGIDLTNQVEILAHSSELGASNFGKSNTRRFMDALIALAKMGVYIPVLLILSLLAWRGSVMMQFFITFFVILATNLYTLSAQQNARFFSSNVQSLIASFLISFAIIYFFIKTESNKIVCVNRKKYLINNFKTNVLMFFSSLFLALPARGFLEFSHHSVGVLSGSLLFWSVAVAAGDVIAQLYVLYTVRSKYSNRTRKFSEFKSGKFALRVYDSSAFLGAMNGSRLAPLPAKVAPFNFKSGVRCVLEHRDSIRRRLYVWVSMLAVRCKAGGVALHLVPFSHIFLIVSIDIVSLVCAVHAAAKIFRFHRSANVPVQ